MNMSGESALTPESTPPGLETLFRRHPRARHYRLRVDTEGRAVVTIPRGGSRKEADRFLEEHREWVAEERAKRVSDGRGRPWTEATRILYRGEWVELILERDFGRPFVLFADQRVAIADPSMDFRRPVCTHLQKLARREFPGRVEAIGRSLGITHERVSIRNQSTRWGSCSCSGTISLNWRLIQVPPEVADYVVIHELAHRIEMNHSERFWRRVSEACPQYRDHESWLDAHARELGL